MPLDECVPTLRDGYYVRKSGAPAFTAPLTAATTISIAGKSTATVSDLAARIQTNQNAVFVVTIANGNIVRVDEKTK